MITEAFLHYLWKTKTFDHKNLKTTNNKNLKIHSYGIENPSDGPDFQQGSVQIDDIHWNGSIEIHINSSDWKKHGHHRDENYDNVILHVVYRNDCDVYNKDGSRISYLEFKNRIPRKVLQRYERMQGPQWIPCAGLIHKTTVISQATKPVRKTK